MLTQGGKVDHFKKFRSQETSRYLLVSSQDLKGRKQTFTYDPISLNLVEITDNHGRKLALSWRADGSIDAISSAERKVSYRYDTPVTPFPSLQAMARLIAVDYGGLTGSVASTRQYHYSEDNQREFLMTGITDENGTRYATFAYDGAGRAILSEHADGAEHYSFEYPDVTTRRITDPHGAVRTLAIEDYKGLGYVTSASQPGGSGCSASTQTIARSWTGTVNSKTDFNGNKICLLSDALGRETSRVSGMLAEDACPTSVDSPVKAGAKREATGWHADYPIVTARSQPGLISTYLHNGQSNAQGQVLTCANGMTLPNGKPFPLLCRTILQSTSDSDGSKGLTAPASAAARTWDYIYDANGNLLSSMLSGSDGSQLPDEKRTYYADTLQGHAIGDLASVITADGATTRYLEYSLDGQLIKLAQPDGQVISFTYDIRQNMLMKRRDDSQGNSEVDEFKYDPAGNLLKIIAPDHSAIFLSYDGAHRLKSIADNGGNSMQFQLDGTGNIIHQEQFDANGALTNQLSQSFDLLGRIQRRQFGPDDPGVEFRYDPRGNLTNTVDQLNLTTTRQYDKLNRLTRLILPTPSPSDSSMNVDFKYSSQDKLASVSDPRQLTTIYSLDSFGQRIGTSSPDSGNSKIEFDSVGRLKSMSDARGFVTAYGWDAVGRLQKSGKTVFLYGAPNDQNYGRLTTLTDSSGHSNLTYDSFGRVQSKKQTVFANSSPRTLQLKYEYGLSGAATGHVTSMTYPSGAVVELTYNEQGRPASLHIKRNKTRNSVPLLTNISYLPFGAVAGWDWGSGTTPIPNRYFRVFNPDGKLISFPLGNVLHGGTLRTLRYDRAGRIVAMTHVGDDGPATNLDQQFDYDGLNRLIGFRANAISQTFKYDNNGNRLSTMIGASSFTNAISTTSNRLTSTSGPAPAKENLFDLAGNLISDGTLSYAYGDDGRMETAIASGIRTRYYYNGFGQRVAKVGPQGANYYIYDNDGKLIGEYDKAGFAIQETVFFENIPVAVLRPTMDLTELKVFYVYADHLGTPRLIAQAEDNVPIWRWDQSDPFGTIPPDENPRGLGNFSYNLRFPGQFFDKETNMYYNYYRDYDPQTGRYVQSDPIGLNGGINTYTYVSGNPVNSLDFFGLAQCSVAFNGGQSSTLKCIPDNPATPTLTIPVASGNNGGGSQCKNRQTCETQSSRGPLPAGDWKWNLNGTGSANSKPNGRRLVPLPGTNTYGRSGFLTHSCINAFGASLGPAFCSEGCITGSTSDMQHLNELLQAEQNSTLHVGE